ncbi:hypothetical protein EJ08DRAFT_652515 [Tothia fuscella]|uniref:DUF7728 domain-containing protein n=1 Tax=Tothia fuscella TaxID=1048955 RepID=A0A9P4NJ64_9PEZI|nr:hypothetical protein EJ08DRAFT_652515 [Tothia fuscella]
MLPSIALCGSLAVAASALMIPSTVSLETVDSSNKHGSLSLIDPYTQILQVGCPGCAFAQSSTDGVVLWTQGVEHNLLLNISVGEQPETLELNGVRFYPPILSLTTEPPVPYISQVPAGHSLVEIKENADLTSKPLRLTAWSFHSGTSHTVNESGEEILTIVLQLNALERQPVSVPDITITALKNTDAQLMLLKIETLQRPEAAGECKDWPLLCKWRGIIADRLQRLKSKGCHKRPHQVHGPPPHNLHHGPNSHHDGAGAMEHHGPNHHTHGGHRQHRHHASLLRVLVTIKNVIARIALPIAIGIVVGLLTFHIGMALGGLAIFMYCKIRPQRTYAAVTLEEEEEEEEDRDLEKMAFVKDDATMSPPVYVEVEAKELGTQ